jgi:hypothetical protein
MPAPVNVCGQRTSLVVVAVACCRRCPGVLLIPRNAGGSESAGRPEQLAHGRQLMNKCRWRSLSERITASPAVVAAETDLVALAGCIVRDWSQGVAGSNPAVPPLSRRSDW